MPQQGRTVTRIQDADDTGTSFEDKYVPGDVIKALSVLDASQNVLGYFPIYDAIDGVSLDFSTSANSGHIGSVGG